MENSTRNVRWAAAIGLVSAVAGLVAASLPGLADIVGVSSTSTGPVVSLNLPALLATYLGVACALAVLQFWFYRRAFATLSAVSDEFSTPSTLTLVAIAGVVLVAIGFALLLAALSRAIQCAGAGNPLTASCLETGEFWGGVASIAIGAIVTLVGYIGLLIGVWRLGTRFDHSLFKVGAVLLIIPYLSVVGEILILIGAQQALTRPRT